MSPKSDVISRGNYGEVDAMNCTVAMDCMEDSPSQSGVAGSARDNPITIDECESPVKISKRAEYYRQVVLDAFAKVNYSM